LEDVKKDRDALKAGREATQRRARDATAALAHTRAQREAVGQGLTQNKAKTQELIGKFRETIQKPRATETRGAKTNQSLAARGQDLKVCIERNVGLYDISNELLNRFEKQGLFTRVALSEPFTRIKRVQLENLIDDYRARAKELRATPAKGAS